MQKVVGSSPIIRSESPCYMPFLGTDQALSGGLCRAHGLFRVQTPPGKLTLPTRRSVAIRLRRLGVSATRPRSRRRDPAVGGVKMAARMRLSRHARNEMRLYGINQED